MSKKIVGLKRDANLKQIPAAEYKFQNFGCGAISISNTSMHLWRYINFKKSPSAQCQFQKFFQERKSAILILKTKSCSTKQISKYHLWRNVKFQTFRLYRNVSFQKIRRRRNVNFLKIACGTIISFQKIRLQSTINFQYFR